MTAASLSLSATPTSVLSDNSTTTTVTVSALSATNAAVPNVVVTLGADTGILGAQTVTTGATGQATFSFSSGTASKSNRTATITATAGAVTTQLPVQINGSTITVVATGNTVPNTGLTPITLTFTAKDAAGTPIPGAAISVSAAGTGTVTLTPVTAPANVTNASGQYVVTVAGTAAGTVTVTASALGATVTAPVTVTAAAAMFGISQTVLTTGGVAQVAATNPTTVSMKTTVNPLLATPESLLVTVSAPLPTANVTFATTMGIWNGVAAQSIVTVPVNAVTRTASATLTSTAAGLATVQVVDANPLNALSDSLQAFITATTPAAITVQATPSVVPRSVGTTTGVSTLVATVTDAAGNPVGGAPVAFSILNTTGGGESVSPVLGYTASVATPTLALGQVMTTFTSGSLSSAATGVQVRAQVPGTAVVTEAAGTNVTASGNDAAIVIGGTAGSVAFGQATALSVNANATAYILAMSVMVADSNGNPAPQGTVVNLSLWPVAWSTGGGCGFDADTASTGTFLNEDANENLILDALEDGSRKYYQSGISSFTVCVPDPAPATTCTNRTTTASAVTTKDTRITAPNSAAGTVPATVVTDANGVATFDLTYPKTSALWIVDRIRARTVVQGSDAVGEIQFRLDPLSTDVTPICRLPNSPYFF